MSAGYFYDPFDDIPEPLSAEEEAELESIEARERDYDREHGEPS